jgi:hypothetical protein
MRWVGLISAVFGALAMSSVAGAVHAQSTVALKPKAAVTDTAAVARDAFALNQSQSRQVIELDSQKRWGLKLEMTQPVTRGVKLKDMEAGAYYKLSPALRLGGALGLADKDAPELQAVDKEQVTPRVKLGAMFKF